MHHDWPYLTHEHCIALHNRLLAMTEWAVEVCRGVFLVSTVFKTLFCITFDIDNWACHVPFLIERGVFLLWVCITVHIIQSTTEDNTRYQYISPCQSCSEINVRREVMGRVILVILKMWKLLLSSGLALLVLLWGVMCLVDNCVSSYWFRK